MSNLSLFTKTKIAGAYFFICPGLSYGIFTSRIPALKHQTQADPAQIGLVLLCVGCASFVSLLTSKKIISRYGDIFILKNGSLAIALSLLLIGLSTTPLMLACTAAVFGLAIGFVDVVMNTQGLLIEQKFKRPALSGMHAANSLGAVVGAFSGVVFAYFDINLLIHAAILQVLYLYGRKFAFPLLVVNDKTGSALKATKASLNLKHLLKSFSFPPFFIIACGIMSACAYSTEGAIAEWGGLLLHDEKGASQSIAALVYALFSLIMVVCRLFGDRLRFYVQDSVILSVGCATSTFGLGLALFSHNIPLSLTGFALTGIGIAPQIPILFSRAGAYPGADPVQASSLVALFSYSGLLLVPPILGFFAKNDSIQAALCLLFISLGLVFCGSFLLRVPKNSRQLKKQ